MDESGRQEEEGRRRDTRDYVRRWQRGEKELYGAASCRSTETRWIGARAAEANASPIASLGPTATPDRHLSAREDGCYDVCGEGGRSYNLSTPAD